MPESVLVSLGSNIDPAVNLVDAVERLARRVRVVRASRVFETEAVGERPMPVFLNAAIEVETDLEPAELKYGVLRPVEAELGRVRTEDRNAPRTLDLDIALFGDRVVRDPQIDLEIPDPDILTHAHVAVPLADLAPGRRHPVGGQRLVDVVQGLEAASSVSPAVEAEALRSRLSILTSEGVG